MGDDSCRSEIGKTVNPKPRFFRESCRQNAKRNLGNRRRRLTGRRRLPGSSADSRLADKGGDFCNSILPPAKPSRDLLLRNSPGRFDGPERGQLTPGSGTAEELEWLRSHEALMTSERKDGYVSSDTL